MEKHRELRTFAAMAMAHLSVHESRHDEVAKESVKYAQALQKALDELEPKCEHEHRAFDDINFCLDCGVRL